MVRQHARLAASLSASIALAFGASLASADDMLGRTVIEDDALGQFNGAALVNQSAGNGNLQVNSALIAVNAKDAARVRLSTIQLSAQADDEAILHAIALIDDRAFADAQGVVLVTQGAGRHNLQVNQFAAALGLEGEVLVEAELSQSRSGAPISLDAEPEGARLAVVGQDAFGNAVGVIQVNQVAGQGNATFNRFVLGASTDAIQ